MDLDSMDFSNSKNRAIQGFPVFANNFYEVNLTLQNLKTKNFWTFLGTASYKLFVCELGSEGCDSAWRFFCSLKE